MNKDLKALYIHIPFCTQICSYCDFYKMRAKAQVKEDYIDTLIAEMALKEELFTTITTIYIGGGSPSSLSLSLLERLFKALSLKLDLSKLSEFSIEVNPLDVTDDLAILFKKYHINRISLGLQSFEPTRLALLGRNHQALDIKAAVKILKNNGFTNINADLIYGLPCDDYPLIRRDLALLINLGFTHISAYALILEEKTLLFSYYQQGKFTPLEDDKVANLYKRICRFLKVYGFHHYEISNFAKPGYESLHNQVYWHNERYLGLGASASYYLKDTRYKNECNLAKYTSGVNNKKLTYSEEINLSRKEQMVEEIILGFRLIKGISLETFYNKYNKQILEVFPIAKDLLKKKMLIIKRGHIMIPKNKLFVSNAIISEFL